MDPHCLLQPVTASEHTNKNTPTHTYIHTHTELLAYGLTLFTTACNASEHTNKNTPHTHIHTYTHTLNYLYNMHMGHHCLLQPVTASEHTNKNTPTHTYIHTHTELLAYGLPLFTTACDRQ